MKEDNRTVNEMIDEAERLEAAGFITKALECWRIVVNRDSDPLLLCRYGSLAMEAEEGEEAKQAFLCAIALDSKLALPYELLGSLYHDQGDIEKALDYFNKSLEIEEKARTFTFLGTVQLQLGLVKEAKESFRKALNLDSDYEEACYNLGVILRYEQPNESIALLQKAVKIDPEYAVAHSELGWSLRQTNQYAEAEYHLRMAIELDDSDGWAYVYLGNLMWVTDDLAAAEQAFKTSVEIWTDSSLPVWCLAHFYEHQGHRQDAEELYERALHIDPNDPQANKRFGIYLKDIGEYKRAKSYLERASSYDREDEQVKALLAALK